MTSTQPTISDISIIIPTLDEEANILRQTEALAFLKCEVIVVDGGSRDNTVQAAEKAGFTVIDSPPGRARQLNCGAERATGEILLFLHADTRLPHDFAMHITGTLADPNCSVGAFKLAIEGKKTSLRAVAFLANLRSELLHLPYGDQALFTSKKRYFEIGGFPDMAIMEDFLFVKEAQKQGSIVIVDAHATTSARRWQKKGLLRTTLINQLVIAGYYLGIDPKKLALLYDR